MTKSKQQVSFSWRNYTKPTPHNLKLFMEFWKGAIVLLTGTSIVQRADEWVSLSILGGGYIVDRLAKFFANVEAEEARKQIIVEFPEKVSGDVTVTEAVVKDVEKNDQG